MGQKAKTEHLSCQTLRQKWISFFESKKHLHLPSASLLPAHDRTLLFTSAGMVPFKAYFEGSETPPNSRIVTIQKCLRTTDLEIVGKTARHCTFFEMLGNFSFGDYFKKEAIAWSYEFSTDHLNLDPEKIHITVYEDDQEAIDIWHKEVGIPLHRITKLGKDTNWWGPAGDSGPCGPCTELYLDRGSEICKTTTGCGHPETCKPGDDCDRFIEYWNLVFNQYNQDLNGKLHPLPRTGIDTGAGLERIVAICNQTDTVYETDELVQIRSKVEQYVKEAGGDITEINDATLSALRVLTDHARSATFALSDNILPDNTGRGYVVRRIIRRALLFAHQLKVNKPILHKLHTDVVNIYGSTYPELISNQKKVNEILLSEEERFLSTLSTGVQKFEEFLSHSQKNAAMFSGKDAFTLYDTFGFPLEMTVELAERSGLTVDMAEFERHMNEQREKARVGGNWKDFKLPPDFKLTEATQTEFTGYDTLTDTASINGIIVNGKTVSSVTTGDEALIATSKTPFYPEGGGQIGDSGYIETDSARFRVEDSRKKGNLIFHFGFVESGHFANGSTVQLTVDQKRRSMLTRHHSATHLLNAGLRSVLGDHILQTGSLVSPDYLRFDFSHSKRLEKGEIEQVEKQVIGAIRAKADVTAKILQIDDAKKTGAVATFGEKYGEQVRVVFMGGSDNQPKATTNYSTEFCGGCHVSNTGDIELFHIIRESSPGAGNRRIEAVAGEKVIEYFTNQFQEIESEKQKLAALIASHSELKPEQDQLNSMTLPATTSDGVAKLLSKNPEAALQYEDQIYKDKEQLAIIEKKLRKQIAKGSQNLADQSDLIATLLDSKESIGSFKIITTLQDDSDAASLKSLADAIRERESKAIFLSGSHSAKGAVLVYSCTSVAADQGIDCSSLIRQTAHHIDGKGGGKKDMAQAGGSVQSDVTSKIEQALNEAKQLLKQQIMNVKNKTGKA